VSGLRIGVVADTHGLLRLEALEALRGADHILHAGDVGDAAVVEGLRQIAPVTAIRGNIDRAGPCATLPATEMVELGGRLFYLVHAIADLDIVPAAAGVSAVISGHSHRAEMVERNGVLYLNPGSIGPRRFGLPLTFAWVRVNLGSLQAEVVALRI
jgi:putative phosphoesterase